MLCDCEGWATKNNLECSDGLIIRKDAFRVDNGKKVPLVWNHQHNAVADVLGHAVLENRDDERSVPHPPVAPRCRSRCGAGR